MAHLAGEIISNSTTENWRNDFPALNVNMHAKPLAFLDSAASAQKPQCVIDAMRRIMESRYANIHRGLYEISQSLTIEFESVRLKIAKFINAPSERNIVFTKNSTESINLIAQSWGRTFLQRGDEIILTQMEHHANIVPWQILKEQLGFEIKVIPILPDGKLNLEAYKNLLSPKTKMIGFVEVSNVLGTINPVKEIVEIARNYNKEIKILIDGSQGIVHKVTDVSQMDCDFYVFTGHKLYGPTGIGVLYAKLEILEAMPPYQGGGDMIEKVSFTVPTTFKNAPYRFEAGTPAIIEVIGLGAAIDYISNIGMENIRQKEERLSNYTNRRLQEINGITIYGPAELNSKAGIFSFSLENAHASDIGMILDQCGVAVRTGHHCCMPLMQALGIDATARASIGIYTNENDIDALIKGLAKVQELFR